MKFLPSPDFDEINGALNFDASDGNVTGACELYSTKSTGSDKKFLRQIDQDLTDKHETLVRLSESLSAPESADFLATSPNMRLFTKDSAFGPLREGSNRRTFAYLISTLNASHPHYDFSNCLRPVDFKKLRDIGQVRGDLDAGLQRFRHSNGTVDEGFDGITGPRGAKSAAWGPHCWCIINKEIKLENCVMFKYSPDSDPFKDDEGAIWSAHYLFFNRDLKRVVYLYARMIPVLSSQSLPEEHPVGSLGRNKRGCTSGIVVGGASKRARFWLGDTDPSLIESVDDDDEMVPDDEFCWNRAEDGHLMLPDEDCTPPLYGDAGHDEDDDDDDGDGDGGGDEMTGTNKRRGVSMPMRGVSEEMVSSMEL